MVSPPEKSYSLFKNVVFCFTIGLLCSCFKEDKTPPIISLSGETNFTVIIGDDFIEPGFTATDKKDGDVTYLVKVSGLPDTKLTGIYYVRYNVSDASGNQAREMTRVVAVSHDNHSLSGIYSATGSCDVKQVVYNDNYFISTEKSNLDKKTLYLIGYEHLSKDNKIKTIIISNTGESLHIPSQILSDTVYSGSGKINNKGSIINLSIIKEYDGSIDSCNTILTRSVNN